jgi:hypothetical protein
MARYDDNLEPASQDRAAKSITGLVVAGALSAFSIALCFTIALHHQLIKLVFVLAFLPWLPIFLKLYFKQKNSAEQNNSVVGGALLAVFLEIVSLVLLASSFADLVHDNAPLIPGILLGLLWLLGLYVVLVGRNTDVMADFSFKDRFFLLLLFGTFALSYGYSVLGLTNRILDSGSPDIYHGQIAGKYTTSGKSGTHYYLKLIGGPDPNGSNLQVSSAQYDATQAGNFVCVAVYPGALGFEWMHSVSCPDQASP